MCFVRTSVFVATKISLSEQKSQQKFCRDKTHLVTTNASLSQQKRYLWRLPPMICQHSWQAWCLLIHLSLSSSKFPVGHLQHKLSHTPVAFPASTARTGWGPSSSSSARVTNLQTSIHALDLQVVPRLCRHAFKEFLNI